MNRIDNDMKHLPIKIMRLIILNCHYWIPTANLFLGALSD